MFAFTEAGSKLVRAEQLLSDQLQHGEDTKNKAPPQTMLDIEEMLAESVRSDEYRGERAAKSWMKLIIISHFGFFEYQGALTNEGRLARWKLHLPGISTR